MQRVQKSLLPEADLPSVQVTPEPGICVKTTNLGGKKVFVNLCKIQEIPPAPPMTEEKLQQIIADENYDTDFKVPMSLGSPREDKDKAGKPCLVSDVAINTVWFEATMENSIVFTTFVIQVILVPWYLIQRCLVQRHLIHRHLIQTTFDPIDIWSKTYLIQ